MAGPVLHVAVLRARRRAPRVRRHGSAVASSTRAAWSGADFAFSFYSIVCFIVAFALPRFAAATSRKTVHATALLCGSVGLLSVWVIHEQ